MLLSRKVDHIINETRLGKQNNSIESSAWKSIDWGTQYIITSNAFWVIFNSIYT